MVPDTTQARLSHDTMRKWAYTGAQTCANRKTQEQTGDKSFMQGGFTRGTAGVGTDTREGKGHQNARQAQEGLVAPKGALELSPKVVLERPGPHLFTVMDYTPPGRASDQGQGRAANQGNAQRETHQPATLPAPGMNRPSVLSPAES